MTNPDAEDDLGYSVPVNDYRQGDLFEADLKWTWILNSIFSSGAAARMGSSATIVLFCLRCSGNYQNGLVSLGQREIAKQTGLSRSSVARALSTLEEEKFIKKEKVSHKRIVYSLDDSVPFFFGSFSPQTSLPPRSGSRLTAAPRTPAFTITRSPSISGELQKPYVPSQVTQLVGKS